MKLTKAEKEIKEVVSEVNRTLPCYEKDWISVKRLPISIEKERCTSFEQFIEARFNYEFFKRYEEFNDLEIFLDGKLFSCTSLEEPDVNRRRFKLVEITLVSPENIPDEYEDLKNLLIQVYNYLGGSRIYFNSVKKKIKLKIKK